MRKRQKIQEVPPQRSIVKLGFARGKTNPVVEYSTTGFVLCGHPAARDYGFGFVVASVAGSGMKTGDISECDSSVLNPMGIDPPLHPTDNNPNNIVNSRMNNEFSSIDNVRCY